jgi:hypothetical protein
MEKVTWPGFFFGPYTMDLHELGDAFDNDPGVYIFCKPSPVAGKWTEVFIGETHDFDESLNRNLTQHPRWDCIVQAGATHVCVLKILGDTQRDSFKIDLCDKLDPPCNRP